MKTRGYHIQYLKGKERKYSIIRVIESDESEGETKGQTGLKVEAPKLTREKLVSALKLAGGKSVVA
jgi:hypothetical protein